MVGSASFDRRSITAASATLQNLLFDAEDGEEHANACEKNDAPNVDARPLLDGVSLCWYQYGQSDETESEEAVDACDDLRLNAVLVLESTCEVFDLTIAAEAEKRCVADIVPHVSGAHDGDGCQTDELEDPSGSSSPVQTALSSRLVECDLELDKDEKDDGHGDKGGEGECEDGPPGERLSIACGLSDEGRDGAGH